MKKLILLTVLFLPIFIIIGAGTASAQKSLRLNSTPKSFQVFYAKFSNAVFKGNKNTVTSLTQFPFEYGFDTEDEGTFSKTEFIKKFDGIFGRERKIFAQKNPTFYLQDGTYNLTDEDDASHYIFKKKGASYKFTAFVAEP